MSLDIVTFKSAPIEIIDGDRGKNYPKQDEFTDEGYCLFLNAKNITENGFNFDTKMFISEEKDNLLRKGKLQKGDVILTTRGTVGNVAFYSEHIPYNNIRINSGMLILRSKQELDNEFLYWTLKSNYFKKQIYTFQSGTAQPQLPISSLKHIEFYLPPINIQKKIVKILSQIDNKIRILKYINKNLEEQLSLLFNDWFVNCTPFKNEELIKSEWGVVPESWKDIEFGELIEITSGNRPDEKSEDKTSEFNIPLFGASKIMGYTKEYSYNEDILIIGRVGTHGVVQRVNYPCFPSDNTFVIKSDYYGFVYQLLKRIDYDSLNTGSTQPLITQKSLKTVNAVLPDEKILSKFEMISKTIFDKIQLNNDEISNLTKLRDTLLPKLMSGEIDVSKINCDLIIVTFYFYFEILFN